MQEFSFGVKVHATPNEVSDEFWHLRDWPQIAPHVKGIRMLYEDSDVQVLVMTVETRGRIDSFKTVRTRRNGCITYNQPQPPPTLKAHEGCWEFSAVPDGTLINSIHRMNVHIEEASRFLEAVGPRPSTDTEAQRMLQEIIQRNSLQTMLAIKTRLETPQEVKYARASM